MYSKKQLIGLINYARQNFPKTWKSEDILVNWEKTLDASEESLILEWFKDWYDLFPKGIMSGGKLVKSDYKGCLKKMVKFKKEHNFPPNIIMEATSAYLSERENADWQYTKSATYFIHKQYEGSELAARCEQLINSKSTTPVTTNRGGFI